MPRRLQYGKKRIYLNLKPRIGYCSWCPNNIHDGSCKRTSMHHYFYMPIMAWACTIEICNKCHKTEHHKLKRKDSN